MRHHRPAPFSFLNWLSFLGELVFWNASVRGFYLLKTKVVCLEKTIQIASRQMHRSFKLCLWFFLPASWPSPFPATDHVQWSAIIWCFDAKMALHRLLHYRITSVSAVFGSLRACVGVSHASWRRVPFLDVDVSYPTACSMGLCCRALPLQAEYQYHKLECKDHSFPIFQPLGLLTSTGCDNYSSRHCYSKGW